MSHSGKIYVQTLILSIALFILGQIVFIKFFQFLEPNVNGVLFQITEQKGKIKTSLLFSLTLAFVPILLLLTWRLSPINLLSKKIGSGLTILIFILLAIWIHRQAVKSYFTRVDKNLISVDQNKNVVYPIDPAPFVYYMFVGMLFGCIASYFLFRQRKYPT